jgi:hypothetical protein
LKTIFAFKIVLQLRASFLRHRTFENNPQNAEQPFSRLKSQLREFGGIQDGIYRPENDRDSSVVDTSLLIIPVRRLCSNGAPK